MARPMDMRQERAYQMWATGEHREGKGWAPPISRVMSIPVRTLYDWRDRYQWDERRRADLLMVGEEATASARHRFASALHKAVSRHLKIIETGSDKDALGAIRLLYMAALPEVFNRLTLKGIEPSQTYIDKQLVIDLSKLSSAELLDATAGILQNNIVSHQNERSAKRIVPPQLNS